MELTIKHAVAAGIKTLGEAVDAEIKRLDAMDISDFTKDQLGNIVMDRYASLPATRDYLIADLYHSMEVFYSTPRRGIIRWDIMVEAGEWPVVLDD